MSQDAKGFGPVTGASSGIGAICADHLAKRGHDLKLVARRVDRLRRLADKIAHETGRKVEVNAADLGKRRSASPPSSSHRQTKSFGMTVQIGAVRRALTSGATRRILGRCALAAIGAGLGAISINALGDDLATGSSRSITRPSQVTRAEYRPITALPSAPSDTNLVYLAAHARMVDQPYEELMHWKQPCPPASTDASMAGQMLSASLWS